MNLAELKKGKIGIVEDNLAQGTLYRRFLDLGLTCGTKVIPLFCAPFGDPTAYRIRGTVIALRREDSELIEIIEEA